MKGVWLLHHVVSNINATVFLFKLGIDNMLSFSKNPNIIVYPRHNKK